MKEIFFYVDDHGEIKNPQPVAKAFQLLPGRYKLTIEDANKRTLPQNAFFHAILPDIQKGLYDMGYREVKTREDAKTVVKSLFAKNMVTNEATGETIPIVQDTHLMTKEEMRLFIDEVLQWCSQYLGLNIASPSSQVGLYDVSFQAEFDNETKTTVIKK